MVNNMWVPSGRIALSVVAFGAAFAVGARADCGISTRLLGPRVAIASSPEGDLGQTLAPAEASTELSNQTQPEEAQSIGSIVGLWNATFTSGGQIADQGFDQWNSDGTEILNDTPPPATGNVCLGVWTKSGETFKLKHPSWTFDAAGNLTGTAIIREKITLDPKGQSYKGTFTVDAFDLQGHAVFHLAGDVKAQRITVDF
jgi:hypothetical protein